MSVETPEGRAHREAYAERVQREEAASPIQITLSLPADCAALVPALRELEQAYGHGTKPRSKPWHERGRGEHIAKGYDHCGQWMRSVDGVDADSGVSHGVLAASRLLMARAVELAATKESP